MLGYSNNVYLKNKCAHKSVIRTIFYLGLNLIGALILKNELFFSIRVFLSQLAIHTI